MPFNRPSGVLRKLARGNQVGLGMNGRAFLGAGPGSRFGADDLPVPEHGSGVILELAHVVWLDIARAITIKEQVEEGYKGPVGLVARRCPAATR
jgi:hypothetical protein